MKNNTKLNLLLAGLTFITISCTNPVSEKVSGPSRLIVSVQSPPGVQPKIIFSSPETTFTVTQSDTIDNIISKQINCAIIRFDKAGNTNDLTGIAYGDLNPLRNIEINGTVSVNVKYDVLPASGKLWVVNDFDSLALAYNQSDLMAPGSPNPTVAIELKYMSPKSIMFDSLGFCWISAFSKYKILVYSQSQLLNSKLEQPFLSIELHENTSPYGMAFDNLGTLWFADWKSGNINAFYQKSLHKMILSTRAAVCGVPDITLGTSGIISNPQGITFDKSGNLWIAGKDPVTNKGKIFKFLKTDLSISGTPVPSVVITETGTNLIGVDRLLFARDGSLWGTDVTSLFNIASNKLTTSDVTTTYNYQLSIPSDIAFDAKGMLWITDGENYIYRLSGTGTPVAFITGASLSYPMDLVFFPDMNSN